MNLDKDDLRAIERIVERVGAYDLYRFEMAMLRYRPGSLVLNLRRADSGNFVASAQTGAPMMNSFYTGDGVTLGVALRRCLVCLRDGRIL